MSALSSTRMDELTAAIEALGRAKDATDHRSYRSDAVPSVHDKLSDLIAECQAELTTCEDDAAHLALWRRQSNGRRGAA